MFRLSSPSPFAPLLTALFASVLLGGCGDDSSADLDANVIDDLGTDVSFVGEDSGPDDSGPVDAPIQDMRALGDATDLGTDAMDSGTDSGPDAGAPTCAYPPSEMWAGPTDEPEIAAPGFRESMLPSAFQG